MVVETIRTTLLFISHSRSHRRKRAAIMDIHILREILCLFTIFSLGLCCNTDWREINGRCFRPFPFEYDFRMARRVCQIYKGDLAFISNTTLIVSISVHPEYDRTKHYWVKEGSYRGNTTSTPLEAPAAASSNGCPYLTRVASNTVISSEDCDKKNPLICEVQKKGTDLICPQTWDLYGLYCFKRSTVQATYADAAGICSLQRGRLAVLDNEDKIHYGLAIVLGWNITYTVGASKTNGTFKWSNGNDFRTNCSECIKGASDMDCMGLLSEISHPTLYTWIKSNCSETHNFLCEMDAVKTTTPAPIQTTTALKPLGCPYGNNWKPHGEYCYWETTYETERLNWFQARTYCQAFGGDLASYPTEKEEDTGIGGARGHYRGLWIGIQRGKEDDIFRWIDGTQMNYTNWEINEPNLKSKSKFCVMHGSDDSRWKLDYCGVRRWFVCKAPLVRSSLMPDLPSFTKIKCNFTTTSAFHNWYLYQDNCYLVVEKKRYSWDTAQTFCQDNGAHLASIHSFQETDFIITITSVYPETDFWIGLNSRNLHSPFTWSDETPLDFLYWADDFVANTTDRVDNCVTFNKREGSWTSDHCNRLYGVVCKRGINDSLEFTSPPTTPALPGNCQSGWYPLGSKCYKIFGRLWSQRVKWNEAKTECEKHGAVLASIHSNEEQDFLNDLIMETGTSIWIGLQTLEHGTLFQWTDDTRIDYTNWNADEPQFSGDPDDELEGLFGAENACVEVLHEVEAMGKWNSCGCFRKNAYVCQKSKDPRITQPSEDPFACETVKGWSRLGSSCYKVFNKNSTWIDAQSECRTYKANLVSFRITTVGLFLRRRYTFDDGYYWTGMREMKEDTYVMVTGQRLVNSNWIPGQPQKASAPMDNCVVINNNNRWLVRSCQEKHPFICEWNTDLDKEIAPTKKHECTNRSGGWEDIGGSSCYLFKEDEPLTWNEAMAYCFRHGGHLASFHSIDDVKLVQEYLTRNIQSRFFHIGLGRRKDGSYAWVDNSPFDFTNWGIGEPDHSDHNCVEMMVIDGKWNDIGCDEMRRGFICSISKGTGSFLEPMAVNTTKQGEIISQKLRVGGIFGIVICILVILAVVGVTIYYLYPSKKMKPYLLETEASF